MTTRQRLCLTILPLERDPVERLFSRVQAYLDFARREPGHRALAVTMARQVHRQARRLARAQRPQEA